MSSSDGINKTALKRVVESYISEETDTQKLEFLWQGFVFAFGSEEDKRILSEKSERNAPADSDSVLSRTVARGPIPPLEFPEEDPYLDSESSHLASKKRRRGGQVYSDKSKRSPFHVQLERGTYKFPLTVAAIQDAIDKYGFDEEARHITEQHEAYLNMAPGTLWKAIFEKAYSIDVSYGALQDAIAYEEMTLPVAKYKGSREFKERYLRSAAWYVWFKTVSAD